MKVLIAGAGGQVGREFEALASRYPDLSLTGFDRDVFDITSPASIQEVCDREQPGVLINAAAYTAVDAAESDADECARVNAAGPEALAQEAASRRIPLFHISTDYVFSGELDRPYREDDRTAPTGVYGATKLAGEEGVRSVLDEHLILRVSWVFGQHGNNFVKTMLRLARERKELRVVADQVGRPTPAAAIAEVLLEAAERVRSKRPIEAGTYHFGGDLPISWHGFAEAIFEEARRHTSLAVERVAAITTEEYPTPARRPANSVLDCSLYESTFEAPLPSWREALASWLPGEIQRTG